MQRRSYTHAGPPVVRQWTHLLQSDFAVAIDSPIDPFRDIRANFIGATVYAALLIPDPVPPKLRFEIKRGREIASYSVAFNGMLPGHIGLNEPAE
jgi:hypothetical protein